MDRIIYFIEEVEKRLLKWTIALSALLLAVPSSASVLGLDGRFIEDFGAEDVNIAAAITVEDDFTEKKILGFTVYVENTLQADAPEDVAAFLSLVEINLTRIEYLVRPVDMEVLRKTKIWATDNNCRHTAAFFYHRKTIGSWLERNGRPAAMAGGVEFCRVDYVVNNDILTNYLVHELAHGFHHYGIDDGFDNEIIEEAYEDQLALRLYSYVLKDDGDYDEAHANSNAVEYFAHLSTKYWLVDSEYPFVSAELKHHDPWGWQIVDAAWTGTMESEWLDCDQIGKVRSGYGSNRIRLEFANKTDDLRYIIWIDQNGEVRWDWSEYIANAGETEGIGTRRNHVFAVFDEEKECVGIFKPGIESETVEITK